MIFSKLLAEASQAHRRWRIPCWIIAFIVAFIPFSQATSAGASSKKENLARELLIRADRIRFPSKGFQVDVIITTTKPGSDPDIRTYRIISKGNDKTLVQTISPAIDRNQFLLMRDRDFWAFLPNLSQPIRLPLSQRLTGQVANGDLARANFVGDYEPQILRTENIDDKNYYVLQLDAIDNWVTYHRVLYWVNAVNSRPYKAEFYAVSGRLLKTAYYQRFHNLGGKLRPKRILIEDAIHPDHRSVLDYQNMRLHDFPDKVFTKDYLKKLIP